MPQLKFFTCIESVLVVENRVHVLRESITNLWWGNLQTSDSVWVQFELRRWKVQWSVAPLLISYFNFMYLPSPFPIIQQAYTTVGDSQSPEVQKILTVIYKRLDYFNNMSIMLHKFMTQKVFSSQNFTKSNILFIQTKETKRRAWKKRKEEK